MIDLNKLHLQYLINAHGEQTAVVLPINEFNELMEDIEDLITFVTRKNESTTTHEDLLKELKNDGLL